jgi:hypothetical protein
VTSTQRHLEAADPDTGNRGLRVSPVTAGGHLAPPVRHGTTGTTRSVRSSPRTEKLKVLVLHDIEESR